MRFYFTVLLLGWATYVLDPKLDLAVSGFLYRPEGGFIYKDLAWVKFSYGLFAWIQWPVLAALSLGLLAGLFSPIWARRRLTLAFLSCALLLGPGLVINEALKNHMGRARPEQITEFGGSQRYTPPWQISDQCVRNCSMSSGHAAMGFFPMALAWVYRRQRRFWTWAGLATGSVVGLGRMMQGGHFLSDVLISAAVVWLVCECLARLMLKRESVPTDAWA
jgi:lipid A 4'-phosphatase